MGYPIESAPSPSLQDFARIQAAVGDFALSATRAIIEFVRNINFEGAIRSVKVSLRTHDPSLVQSGENAGTVGRTLSVVGNSISITFSAIAAAVGDRHNGIWCPVAPASSRAPGYRVWPR